MFSFRDCKVILKYKQWLMGVAMLLVVLIHSRVIGLPFLKVFAPGAIGVDIFLFLSGYSLCLSYVKRPITDFFKRRVVRILPTYVLMAVAVSLVFVAQGRLFGLWDWVCNLTTLSYYRLGGAQFEWYLSVLFLFYLAFPLLFKLVKSVWVYAAIAVLCAVAVFFLHPEELHECAITRVPVFCLGILCFHMQNDEKGVLFVVLVSFLFFLLGIVLKLPGTFLMDMVCFPLVLALYRLSDWLTHHPGVISKGILRGGEMLGVHSLSIYAANIVTFYLCHLFEKGAIRAVVYCVAMVILSFLFIRADGIIQKRI